MKLFDVIHMWLSGVPPSAIYTSQAQLKAEGVEASVAELVLHYLASNGNMDGLTRVVAEARRHGLPIDVGAARAIVLAGQEDAFRERMADPENRRKHLEWWDEAKLDKRTGGSSPKA